MNTFSLNSIPFQLECLCYSSFSLCFPTTMKRTFIYPEILIVYLILQGTGGHSGNDGVRPAIPVAEGVGLVCLESHFKQ